MDFYPKRSIEEQASRLPEEYRENYDRVQLDRIWIDGCEISGYFEYSFMEEKSYKEQPVRSQDGTIVDLEQYSTFLTPRLIIKYNMMGIGDYRKLMTLLQSKNAFEVTCYDEVRDRHVTHEMYFAPPSMPIIYQKYLKALGIQDCSIELIGTNRSSGSFEITIGTEKYTAYVNEDWMRFVRRNPKYKIVYLADSERFAVLNYEGERVKNSTDDVFVSPYDIITNGKTYTLQ